MANPDRKFLVSLNTREGEIAFEALAELPFKYVFELIGRMNRQANENIAKGCNEKIPFDFTMNRLELDLMIRALGGMPFQQVHRLVENLNAQIGHQIKN